MKKVIIIGEKEMTLHTLLAKYISNNPPLVLEVKLPGGETITRATILQYSPRDYSALVEGEQVRASSSDRVRYSVADLTLCRLVLLSDMRQTGESDSRPQESTLFPRYTLKGNIGRIAIGQIIVEEGGKQRTFHSGKNFATMAQLLCDAGSQGVEEERIFALFSGKEHIARPKVHDLTKILRPYGYEILRTEGRYSIVTYGGIIR